jgi:hypothetical protein
VRFLSGFFRESPQVVLAEFRAARAAAGVTVLAKGPVTNTYRAKLSADFTPDILIFVLVLVHEIPWVDG